MAPHILPFNA